MTERRTSSQGPGLPWRIASRASRTAGPVAGGTGGINLGIAGGFAAAGVRVAVMRRSKEKVDASVTRLQALGALATGEAADVRDPPWNRGVLCR